MCIATRCRRDRVRCRVYALDVVRAITGAIPITVRQLARKAADEAGARLA